MQYIGVSCACDGTADQYAVKRSYLDAVRRCGGCPVLLTQLTPPESLPHLVAGLDGLLVPGGIDVSPLLYGQEPIQAVTFTQEAQDRFELALIREAVAQGKPILAVCRGAQLVNVALGGTLYQDIHEQAGATICHRQDSRIPSECTHTISTVPGTLFERLMNGQTAVNSFHHQAIRDLAPGLVAAAWSADGILEAFESPTRPILGVQFHPELLLDAAPGFLALFQQLVHWE